jgi:GNAT superfamily N-acetyltransferase
MPSEFEIHQLTSVEGPIVRLIDEANAAGFPFMDTLRREWEVRSNRFDRPGEVYLEVWRSGELVAAGGLNIDPYSSDPKTGRIRHVYVLAAARRHGAGQFLLSEIIRHARPIFNRLRLRTRTKEGAAFYEAIGFSRSDEDAATHLLEI